MKKSFLCLCLLLFSFGSFAHGVRVFWEETQTGYTIYADNEELCPMSIKLVLDLENLRVENEQPYYVVKSAENRQLLTELIITDRSKAFKFHYKFRTNYGDVGQTEYDKDYLYYLPYQRSESFKVYQGYNGSFSHQEKKALDFTMPIGTEVTAVREGVVVEVEESNHRSCAEEECIKFNNYVMVQHPDGTFSQYVHIQREGALVDPGDIVEQGQLIAYSGNVGYSTGPHLHLEIFLQRMEVREYIETQFLTNSGEMAELLEEKKQYKREY